MTNYKITVNGNTYDVGVEEVGGDPEVKTVSLAEATSKAAPAPKAAPQKSSPASKQAAAPSTAAKQPSASKAAPVPSGPAEDVLAPLPGTVISVNVSEGDRVKANQVLLIFEAMKMENEIVASRAGIVTKIHVAKGDVLESGKAVVSLA